MIFSFFRTCFISPGCLTGVFSQWQMTNLARQWYVFSVVAYNNRYSSWCNIFLSVHVNSSYFSPFLIKVYYRWYPIVLFACRIVDDILFLLTRRSCICWKRCFDFLFLFFTLVRWRMGIFVFYLWFQCNLLLITPVFNWCASSRCSFERYFSLNNSNFWVPMDRVCTGIFFW